MITYKIMLYDPKIKKTTTFAKMPERRINLKRPRGKPSVINWLKCIYGKEWYLSNRNLIGILEHNERTFEK